MAIEDVDIIRILQVNVDCQKVWLFDEFGWGCNTREILSWVEDNLDSNGVTYLPKYGVLFFDHEQDAMAFKLMWL